MIHFIICILLYFFLKFFSSIFRYHAGPIFHREIAPFSFSKLFCKVPSSLCRSFQMFFYSLYSFSIFMCRYIHFNYHPLYLLHIVTCHFKEHPHLHGYIFSSASSLHFNVFPCPITYFIHSFPCSSFPIR